MQPISMCQVADAAVVRVLHLMMHIPDRKDRVNTVTAIDLIGKVQNPLKKNLQQNQYLEMLAKVTLQGKAQAHVVLKMSFPSSPGAKAKRSG